MYVSFQVFGSKSCLFFSTRQWCFENSSIFSKIPSFQIYSRQVTFFFGSKSSFSAGLGGRSQAFFSKFDAILDSWGMIFNSNTRAATGIILALKHLQRPFGVQRRFTRRARSASLRMDGWDGMDGWTEYQKCPLKIFILCRYIEKGIYLHLHVIKNSRQHSYGF